MNKIANIRCRTFVQKTLVFKANNIFAEWSRGWYVVYSYGHHWPMYAWKDGRWFRNISKYSVTTSKHSSQCKPSMDCEEVTCGDLIRMIEKE